MKHEYLECEIVTAIRDVVQKLDENFTEFNTISDSDMLEAIIYERCALEAKYAYLIKKAREYGITDY